MRNFSIDGFDLYLEDHESSTFEGVLDTIDAMLNLGPTKISIEDDRGGSGVFIVTATLTLPRTGTAK